MTLNVSAPGLHHSSSLVDERPALASPSAAKTGTRTSQQAAEVARPTSSRRGSYRGLVQ